MREWLVAKYAITEVVMATDVLRLARSSLDTLAVAADPIHPLFVLLVVMMVWLSQEKNAITKEAMETVARITAE